MAGCSRSGRKILSAICRSCVVCLQGWTENERHELLRRVLGHGAVQAQFELAESADEVWASHLSVLTGILNKEPADVG